MIMKKSLLIIFIFTTSNSYGSWFNNKLQQYTCKSYSDSQNCSNCEIEKNNFLEFKVDKNSSRVFFTAYEGNKVYVSGVNDNCKIFDEKNWSCTNEIVNLSFTEDKMTNGIYSSYHTYDKRRPFLKDSFSCGK